MLTKRQPSPTAKSSAQQTQTRPSVAKTCPLQTRGGKGHSRKSRCAMKALVTNKAKHVKNTSDSKKGRSLELDVLGAAKVLSQPDVTVLFRRRNQTLLLASVQETRKLLAERAEDISAIPRWETEALHQFFILNRKG